MEQLVKVVVVLAFGLLSCNSASGDESATPTPRMREFVVGLLYQGSAWTPQETDETRRIQEGHMANIQRLVQAEALAVAGPFEDAGDLRGMYIFNVRTIDEARRLVDTDPAIASKRLRFELYRWYGPTGIATVVKGPPQTR